MLLYFYEYTTDSIYSFLIFLHLLYLSFYLIAFAYLWIALYNVLNTQPTLQSIDASPTMIIIIYFSIVFNQLLLALSNRQVYYLTFRLRFALYLIQSLNDQTIGSDSVINLIETQYFLLK